MKQALMVNDAAVVQFLSRVVAGNELEFFTLLVVAIGLAAIILWTSYSVSPWLLCQKHGADPQSDGACKDFPAVQSLLAYMDTHRVPLGPHATFQVLKAAVQDENFDEALQCFKDLRRAWEASGNKEDILSPAVLGKLVELACNECQLSRLLPEITLIPLPVCIIDIMLAKSMQDVAMVRAVEALARTQRETLQDSTFCLLLKALASKPFRVRVIVEEVLSRKGSSFSPDLVLAVLEVCRREANEKMAWRLLERAMPRQMRVLSEFIWFYIQVEQYEQVCDVYELHMQPAVRHADKHVLLDADLHESIVDAAVVCGRTELAERVLAESTSRAHAGFVGRCLSELMERAQSLADAAARCHAVIACWAVLVF